MNRIKAGFVMTRNPSNSKQIRQILLLPAEEHIRLFSRIAGLLQGYTTRVVVSFADFYKKTERNLQCVNDLTVSDITQNREQYSELSKALSQIAAAHDMEIFSCSEKAIDPEHDIPHGACIDAALIEKLFHLHLSVKKDKNQRTECLCVQSVDIGAYNTCVHGCQYCYATYHHQQAVRNFKQHDPDSPFLMNPAELIPVRY